MAEKPVCVVDTNVLLNLATPVVDSRPRAPTGADPLKALLVAYDVHTTRSVIGEVTAARGSGDLLSAAADLVLQASRHLTVQPVAGPDSSSFADGLDRGEAEAIWLANDLGATLFVTDEFNTTNFLFVGLALDDRNTLYTSPHVLAAFGARGVLSAEYVDGALTYYVETKGWDRAYVEQLRRRYLHG